MEALAARGNLAEATLAYDRLRTLLRDELGTTPAPALVALHDRLLAGDAAPGPSSPPPARARSRARSGGPRSGRSWRAGARPRACGGPGRRALRRCSDWRCSRANPASARPASRPRSRCEAHADGGEVLLGRCHPEALVPYEPFVEALRQLPAAALHAHAPILGRLLPELPSEPGLEPASGDDHATRYLLFDAVARSLEAAARRSPLLFVLEDLHWAEPPTLLLLRHVVRAAEGVPLLIVATYRSTEARGSEQVVAAVASLERDLPVERVALGGLADDEVAELILALDGRPSSLPLGTAMRHDTAGNPLFVGQLLRHLDESGILIERDGELTLRSQERIGVPDSARELVAARLAGLNAGDGLDVARRGRDRPRVRPRAARGGRAATPVRRARRTRGRASRPGWSSSWTTPATPSSTRSCRRRSTTARAPGAARPRTRPWPTRWRSAPVADPAELAHHFLAAGERDKGVEYSVATASRAIERLAYEDAVAHYAQRARGGRRCDEPRRCGLLLGLADAHARAGDTPTSKLVYREAAALAEQLSLPEQLAEAAVGYGGRLIWEVSRDDPDVLALLERALAQIGAADSALRVRLLARIGGGPLRDDHDPTRRRAVTGEALEMARRVADPATLAYALDGYISAHHSPDFTPRQVELAGELIEASLAAGELERAIEAYEHRAAGRLELGDVAGAAADVEEMAPLAAELRQPAQDWFVAERRAVQALHEGRIADAEALSSEALRLGGDTLSWSARVCHVLQLAVIRRLQGRPADVAPDVRAAAEEYAPSYPVCRCALLPVLAARGDEAEARAGLDALAPDDFGALDFDETWLGALAFLAEAAHALGECEHAGSLYELLAPYADRIAVSTPEVSLGGVPRYLGLLAAAAGRPALAAEQFEARRGVRHAATGHPASPRSPWPTTRL